MSDSDKALGQAVQEEPSDKLHCGDGDGFHLVFLPVFGGEGYSAVFNGSDATVCNGHPMGIACQIFKDMFRTFYGITNTDHPVFRIQFDLEVLIRIAEKVNLFIQTGMAHTLYELAPEYQR